MSDIPLIRPLAAAETAAIVDLYARSMQTEPNIGPVSAEQWERFLRAPQNNHGRDFRVADLDGTIIGLAESSLRQQAEGRVRYVKLAVDPAHRRRGVATDLLRTLIELDTDHADIPLQGLTREGWTAGEGFLAAMGFQYLESDFTMICRELLPIAPPADDGVDFMRADDPVVHAADVARIHNAAFASDVAFRAFATDEMVEDLRNEGDDLWLARDGDDVIGFCRIEMDGSCPWLESIAIDPTFQGRGIGPRLAYHALSAYGVSDNRRAGLSVSSSNPNARRVYARLGFFDRGEKRRYGCDAAKLRGRLSLRS